MLDLELKKNLDNFLNKKTTKQKIIVIYWPTASWKTKISIDIAKYINSEIIWTDSRQIFKYLDIWTWKITKNEMQWIKHHMIDIITPDKSYSVWEFKKQSEKIINNLKQENKIPILAWWTGLYIDSLIYDFDIPSSPSDLTLRKKLEKEAGLYWKNYVYNKLLEIDSEYWKTLHPNNLNYVIRGIEVKMLTWKSKLDFRWDKKLKYDVFFYTPYNKDRESLYNNINKRVENMFKEGLILEVKSILNKWYKIQDFGLKTIWYKEVISFLNWEITNQECIELVAKHNRNYAKRQLTWFNKYL